MPLKDYQDIVGSTAAVVTIAQFFSPLFICKKIVSQGNTNNVDPTPFVGGIGIGLLFLRHGYLLNDPAMIPVNLFAIGLNIIYFLIFLAYSDCRGAIFTNLVKSVVGACAIVSYTFIDPK
uniref:Sugar transporter SWEET1 n=1 Tax=Lygus hesperus TaxID=30085 RepID=A0A0A9XEH5_LYGHE